MMFSTSMCKRATFADTAFPFHFKLENNCAPSHVGNVRLRRRVTFRDFRKLVHNKCSFSFLLRFQKKIRPARGCFLAFWSCCCSDQNRVTKFLVLPSFVFFSGGPLHCPNAKRYWIPRAQFNGDSRLVRVHVRNGVIVSSLFAFVLSITLDQ